MTMPKRKPFSVIIQEMTDAGYRPREIFKRLKGKVSIKYIYKVRARRSQQTSNVSFTSTEPVFAFKLVEEPLPWHKRAARWLWNIMWRTS